MNENIKRFVLCLTLSAAFATDGAAQKLTGRVVNSANQPITDVVITSPGCKTTRSGSDGSFTMEDVNDGAVVSFRHEGFYTKTEYLKNADVTGLNVYMIE